jgi:hypothetical protein
MAESIQDPPLLTPCPKTDPSPEAPQNPRILPGSPLAIIGLFVEVIRKRFAPTQNAIYTWDPDPKRTQLAIESAFNEDDEIRNKRPAIFVDKDDSTIGRTVVGDFAGMNFHSGKKGFWALSTVPILIECVAAKKGECAILGDLIQMYLHASSDLIQSKFGLHEMTPVILGRTQPFERDKAAWITPVNFSIQYNVRWTNTPAEHIVNEIAMTVAVSGYATATEFFERCAVK